MCAECNRAAIGPRAVLERFHSVCSALVDRLSEPGTARSAVPPRSKRYAPAKPALVHRRERDHPRSGLLHGDPRGLARRFLKPLMEFLVVGHRLESVGKGQHPCDRR